MKALTFTLQGAPFGMSITPVREIIGVGELTPVPLMPAFLQGVMNLRGDVVPVIDLAARLGLPSRTPDERSCIVLMDATSDEGMVALGVLVDEVQEVIDIDESALLAAPAFGTRVAARHIAGMVELPGRHLTLLALDDVLDTDAIDRAVRDGGATR